VARGGAYGYVDMSGWIGGQAEYVMVPYADFNWLRFPDKDQAMEKIRDLTCLTTGSTVVIASAGPSDWRLRLPRRC
jgi:glutathione-independent formaldehyde dehydrogenase